VTEEEWEQDAEEPEVPSTEPDRDVGIFVWRSRIVEDVRPVARTGSSIKPRYLYRASDLEK
jgi:hypothetical protein